MRRGLNVDARTHNLQGWLDDSSGIRRGFDDSRDSCYNSEASHSVLLYTYTRTDMALAGLTSPAIIDRVTAALASKQLPPEQPGSIAYMMSKDQYLGDAVMSWMPHLMFYPPKSEGVDNGIRWGASLPGSPVVFDGAQHADPEPWTLFFALLSHWSDGSPAAEVRREHILM